MVTVACGCDEPHLGARPRAPGARSCRVIVWLVSLGLLAWARPANAHALGASSVNRYLDFQYTGDASFRVAYVLDFAEAPAYAEIDALDANHDGSVTPEEQRAYLDARLPPLVRGWVVEVDGARVVPTIVASHLDVSQGEGGRETLRIEAEVRVHGDLGEAAREVTLHVHDEAFADHPGWREIEAENVTEPDAGRARTSAALLDASAARRFDARFEFRRRRSSRLPAREPASWPARAALLVAIAAFVVGARSWRRGR